MRSEFHSYRSHHQPNLPDILKNPRLKPVAQEAKVLEGIKALFPELCKTAPQAVTFEPDTSAAGDRKPLKIGVVLSGGQAAGGHNVIVGIYDYLKARHPDSTVIGFKNGPIGIYEGKYVEIKEETIQYYKNRGGFDMICSGRNKIETPEQFANSKKFCEELHLDGLIVIGGDDSNTNACLLAEYFLKENCKTKVIGCPKTIDGDLKNEFVEVSFGFDTACRVFSELIGNLNNDVLSTKSDYHFVRLMGRSASHITIECALHTRPTYAVIGEEVAQKKYSLGHIVEELVNIIVSRAKAGKNYGVVLVPEGTIEFINEVGVLIGEINTIMGKKLTEEDKNKGINEVFKIIESNLTPDSAKLLNFLPRTIAEQLLCDRDPHGNVQVSKIETEKLLISTIQEQLEVRRAKGEYNGTFRPISHFYGYEGRCAFPTNFDADYCYSLGVNAAGLVDNGYTGVMSVVRNLAAHPSKWSPGGFPLVTMMDVETRKGKSVPVIKKALVELDGPVFKAYAAERQKWAEGDYFQCTGPVQFEITTKSTDAYPQRVPFLVAAPTKEEIAGHGKEFAGEAYSHLHPYNVSTLSADRAGAFPAIPEILHNHEFKVVRDATPCGQACKTSQLAAVLKHLTSNDHSNHVVEVAPANARTHGLQVTLEQAKGQRIGIAFTGEPAPGAMNVAAGLLAYCEKTGGELVGFLEGPDGLHHGKTIVLTKGNLSHYLNQGGVGVLGQSHGPKPTEGVFVKIGQNCEQHKLNGLVMVGGACTMMVAIRLAEHFLEHKIKTNVIAVPATIDGTVEHHMIEANLGFDSATKVFSQQIGNILIDAASAVKYWYFIRLGGNSSRVVLECALQNHPSVTLIGEEIQKNGQDIEQVVKTIADVVVDRAAAKKNFGTVLIPENLLQYLPKTKSLIAELNAAFQTFDNEKERNEFAAKLWNNAEVSSKTLTKWSAAFYQSLPELARQQLVAELLPDGTISLRNFETEKLLNTLVLEELAKRKKANKPTASLAVVFNSYNYEGRSAMPSIFDSSLGTTYGYTAGCLIGAGVTGYVVTARGLTHRASHWQCGGIPLIAIAKTAKCKCSGAGKVVVEPAALCLHSHAFQEFNRHRATWEKEDHLFNPGPTQYHGAQSHRHTAFLNHSQHNYPETIVRVQQLLDRIQQATLFGATQCSLSLALPQLEALDKSLAHHKK